MDYEKKYKEALERIKDNEPDENGIIHIRPFEIFPELKESEDERIRNALIEAFNYHNYHNPWTFLNKRGITGTDITAWIEKQGEQNIVVVIPKFRVGDVIRPKGSVAEYTIESISGECYHGKGWGLHISSDDDYELVEQKPVECTWKPSNEQMEALNDVISSRDIKYDVLSELWKDLKKLKD